MADITASVFNRGTVPETGRSAGPSATRRARRRVGRIWVDASPRTARAPAGHSCRPRHGSQAGRGNVPADARIRCRRQAMGGPGVHVPAAISDAGDERVPRPANRVRRTTQHRVRRVVTDDDETVPRCSRSRSSGRRPCVIVAGRAHPGGPAGRPRRRRRAQFDNAVRRLRGHWGSGATDRRANLVSGMDRPAQPRRRSGGVVPFPRYCDGTHCRISMVTRWPRDLEPSGGLHRAPARWCGGVPRRARRAEWRPRGRRADGASSGPSRVAASSAPSTDRTPDRRSSGAGSGTRCRRASPHYPGCRARHRPGRTRRARSSTVPAEMPTIALTWYAMALKAAGWTDRWARTGRRGRQLRRRLVGAGLQGADVSRRWARDDATISAPRRARCSRPNDCATHLSVAGARPPWMVRSASRRAASRPMPWCSVRPLSSSGLVVGRRLVVQALQVPGAGDAVEVDEREPVRPTTLK